MADTALPWFERPLTHHDLDELPENDGVRYEVIDGELYMSPFPVVAHQYVVAQLMVIIGAYLWAKPIGQVFPSGTKVVLDEPTGVGPDLIYIARENLANLLADGFYGPPDLIVEILSSKPELDRIVKYRKYAAAQVPRYWIIDPRARTLEALLLQGGRYVLEHAVSGDQHLQPSLFPGLDIPLASLWL